MPLTGSTAPERASLWPVLGLSLLAAAVAWLSHELLYPALSWNRDEPVYLWQADALRAGFLTPPDGGHPASFLPWLSGHDEGSLFTQYTLGWPLVLAASALATGSTMLVLPLGAALAAAATFLFGVELLADRKVATLATLLVIASPIFPIQAGAYLSYVFTLGLGLLHITLVLAGLRCRRPTHLVAAGVVLGAILLTRPYDAILWAVAAAGCAVLTRRGAAFPLMRAGVLVGAATAPFVGVAAAYNRHVTGRLLELPITQVDPLDTFGFGARRLMPALPPVDYDLTAATRATAKNLFVLPWFLAGTYVALIVAAWVIWRRRRAPATTALLLVGAVFPVGYFAFWGTHLSSLASRISGPIYFVPLYAPICLLVASGLLELWRDDRRRAASALLLLIVATTVPAAINRFSLNHEISDQQRAWARSVAGLDGPALVFVADSGPYLLHLNPFSRNAPTLDGRVLYATATSTDMLELIEEQPARRPYLQVASVAAEEIGPREDPARYDVALVPITVHRSRVIDLDVSVSPPPGVRVTDVEIESATGAQELSRGRTTIGVKGSGAVLELTGAGRVTITAELELPARGEPALVRASYVYRVVRGEVELLDPPALERWTPVDDSFEWRHTVTLPEMSVVVQSS